MNIALALKSKPQINLVTVIPLTRVQHVCLVNWYDLNIVFNIGCNQFCLPKVKADFSVPTTKNLNIVFWDSHRYGLKMASTKIF